MSIKNNVESKKRIYSRSNNLVMRKIADEFLLIPITQIGADVQKVFSMNHTAAAIWQCLDNPLSLEKVLSQLAGIYDVDEDTVCSDVQETLTFLVERGFCLEQGSGLCEN